MKVVVGLGNPGKNYEDTRHNVGFAAIDRLAVDYGIEVIRAKHKALTGDRIINGEKLMLVKPMTFMNLSGESVGEIINYYKLELMDIIVVYDDVSLPLGNVRVREQGSDGGHKGMKSITRHLGSDNFTRVRIGVGEPPKQWDMADYVLSGFSALEKASVSEGVKNAVDCVRLILAGSVREAMNKYNKKNKPQAEEPAENTGGNIGLKKEEPETGEQQ